MCRLFENKGKAPLHLLRDTDKIALHLALAGLSCRILNNTEMQNSFSLCFLCCDLNFGVNNSPSNKKQLIHLLHTKFLISDLLYYIS